MLQNATSKTDRGGHRRLPLILLSRTAEERIERENRGQT